MSHILKSVMIQTAMINYLNITDLNSPALAVYAKLNEAQLKHYYEPAQGLFICESPKVIRRALDAGYLPESVLFDPKQSEGANRELLERITASGGNHEIPAYAAPEEVLKKITGYHLTGGMLCAMKRKVLPSPEELLKNARRVVVLEDVENPTNIGAIFRSAAALSMDAVFLTHGCSDPLYRRAARVSVGTVFQIPWTFFCKDIPSYMELLHHNGWKTAALALTEHSVSVDNPMLKKEPRLALLFGNEQNGLCSETITTSDYIVRIPMAEGVDSLNVAAASAVAFWELRAADFYQKHLS